MLPDALLHGTKSALLNALMGGRAELDAAMLACSAAAAEHTVAEIAMAGAKFELDIAIAMDNAARHRESHAKMRSSAAIKRHHTALKIYRELLGSTHSEARSSATSTVSRSPTPGGKSDTGTYPSDVEDSVCDIDEEVFEGISIVTGDAGEGEAEEMDLA
jgi:hypothetical protein